MVSISIKMLYQIQKSISELQDSKAYNYVYILLNVKQPPSSHFNMEINKIKKIELYMKHNFDLNWCL